MLFPADARALFSMKGHRLPGLLQGWRQAFVPQGAPRVFLAFLFFLLQNYHRRLERRFSLPAQGCSDS